MDASVILLLVVFACSVAMCLYLAVLLVRALEQRDAALLREDLLSQRLQSQNMLLGHDEVGAYQTARLWCERCRNVEQAYLALQEEAERLKRLVAPGKAEYECEGR